MLIFTFPQCFSLASVPPWFLVFSLKRKPKNAYFCHNISLWHTSKSFRKQYKAHISRWMRALNYIQKLQLPN